MVGDEHIEQKKWTWYLCDKAAKKVIANKGLVSKMPDYLATSLKKRAQTTGSGMVIYNSDSQAAPIKLPNQGIWKFIQDQRLDGVEIKEDDYEKILMILPKKLGFYIRS